MKSYSDLNKQPNRLKIVGFIPLTIVIVGFVFIVMQFISNTNSYLDSIFWQVKHPSQYAFTKYDHLLHYYVKDGLVDYGALKHSAELNDAVNELSHTSPDKLASTDQLCFWINAYNLLVIKNIVDHYPLTNLTKIEEAVSLHKFLVGGKPYSLQDIEILELIPRLSGNVEPVFLLCGGGLGFPDLQNHAIQSNTLSSDAVASTIRFINDLNNVYFYPQIKTLLLTPFFKWHQTLISTTGLSLIDFINKYLSADKQINIDPALLRIEYKSSFNWYLNDINLTHP